MSLLLNRALYAADLTLGRLLGDRCPNCDRRPQRPPLVNRHHGISPVYACDGCGVYYRPVAFRGGRILFGSDPAADRKRKKDLAGHRGNRLRPCAPAFERGRHVENHDLVDALGIVAAR